MKSIKTLIARLLLLLPMLTACLGKGEEATQTGPASAHGGSPVQITFDIPGMRYSTRSASVSDDAAIRDVNLFLYRNGRLEWKEYRESGDPITLRLLVGETYSIYALANVGQADAPASEQEIHSYTIESGAMAGRIPMASVSGLSVTVASATSGVSVPSENQVNIELVRLAAKYNFKVDRSGMQYGTFTVESVRICQAARSVEVFAPESQAASAAQVSDGDYASAQDLSGLNNSSSVSFYMLENRHGTLLPGNTDPWKKEYFNASVASAADLCTYLEVKGHYRDRSGGLNATHTYRMYLGKDATTNFDVIRNTEYTLTLVVSDLGAWKDSWKVDRGDITDTRSLRFEPAELEIASLGSAEARVVGSPSGIDYSLSWDAAAFAGASLAEPDISGDRILLSNLSELEEDRTVYLRAVSFDGSVSAVCTLLVRAGGLPELELEWRGSAPAYVAQAGTIHCSPLFSESELTAVSSDPSVVRVVPQGENFRIEAIREGSATVTVTRTDGTRTSTKSLSLSVLPVYMQVSGMTYQAFADGGANALRLDGGNHETWSLSYNIARSQFDDALYAELLTPCHTAIKSGSASGVDYFAIDEAGLYVSGWGSDLSALAGTYTVNLTPRENIYAGEMETLSRTVVIEAPISVSGSSFSGENRYYMPDPEQWMSLSCSGTADISLGDPSRLKICIGYPTGGYGEGSGYLPCPYELSPLSSGNGNCLLLKPSYSDMVRFFPNPYRVRGKSLRVFAQITNALSGKTGTLLLGETEIWLDLAVTSKLERWQSASQWDVTEEDHYFIVPCFYSERFESGMITYSASSAGGGGDVALPPFYIPQNILTGIPKTIKVDGATICLSEPYPGPSFPSYLDYQLHSREYGALLCPDITNWLWDECGFSGDDFSQEPYEALADGVGNWYHRKLYWRLYDQAAAQAVPDGGYFDIPSYGGYTGNYYIRICDYAKPLENSDFEE